MDKDIIIHQMLSIMDNLKIQIIYEEQLKGKIILTSELKQNSELLRVKCVFTDYLYSS